VLEGTPTEKQRAGPLELPLGTGGLGWTAQSGAMLRMAKLGSRPRSRQNYQQGG
jgi:hypothetical protein